MTTTLTLEQQRHLSGFCGLSWSLQTANGRASHDRCRTSTCPCSCHAATNALATATQQQALGTTPTITSDAPATPWEWDADTAAQLITTEPHCPMCNTGWDEHTFTDTDTLQCPSGAATTKGTL